MADGLEKIGSRRHFQYIVVGCGGIGSGALYWLSKRAPGDVLGLEQFQLGHDNGGSQDVSRIIRLTYHDDRYTWAEVERESGQQLVYKTGGLQLSERGLTDHITEHYAQSMQRNNIPFERLTAEQLKARFPQFTPAPNTVALFEKEAGLVDAALGNATHVQLARGNGAVVIDRCPVTTTLGKFTCRRLVVTAGAWINDVLGSIGVQVPVTVTQEQVTYFATPHMKDFSKDRFPIMQYHTPTNNIYALPIHGNSGTKIGIDAAGPHVTANTRTFTPDPARVKVCTDLLQQILPKFLGPVLFTKTCLYAMTPDRHFVVDTCSRQGYSDVIVCNGAGHAYKFASLLGKILSELAVDGRTRYDILQFNMDRPAITDPNFKPTRNYVDAKL
ncbi:hypothetical protein BaRGS_00031276 [Batillaria attramentaria]|uniref:FAD dependent oxidoreductase domain-containing protein n=1 Tax=Batillaria attramentaria TaxID=370345 RepID=A0ABD0JSA7_9CAEN